MPAIKDKALAKLYTALETQLASDPSTKIDSSNVVELLATVADGTQGSAAKMVTALNAAPTKQAQLDLVQKGLSKNEKKDLESILDTGTVPLAAEWKNFFEAVVGRAQLNTGGTNGNAALQINASQAGGFLSGTATPGATIEVINLSQAPTLRLHTDDTVQIGKADASGKFSAKLTGVSLDGTQTGDILRVRTRDAQGKESGWVTIRASGINASDTRNAEVALFRIGLAVEPGDKIAVTNINASRQISEPGAQIQLKNDRTGKTWTVTLDSEGTFPAGVKIEGKAGDSITVSASDGTNNKTFATAAGKLVVAGGGGNGGNDIKDPDLHKDELNADGTPKFGKVRYSGPLFVNEPSPLDVRQGQIGDCYFPSACAALAQARPDLVKNAVKDNGDGTYTVTFKERNWSTGSVKDKQVTVDGDLYVRSWGGPLYGSTTGNNQPTTMEMWFPILEKAYAAYKGSYNAIGNGGSASAVMSALTGMDQDYLSLNSTSPSRVTQAWNEIKDAVDNKRPAALGTSDDEAKYKNTGIYGDHSYSVLGYEEKNGVKYVKIRNPWGESEPSGNGANDGVFLMKIEDVVRLYDSLDTVR